MSTPTELTISGCKVKFPAKAYRSQVAMMAKIITSLQRSQNSLLESPTGSGKSLALLCASLSWQEAETEKVREFNALLEQATNTQDPALRDALLAKSGPGVEMEDEYVPGGFVQPNLEDAAVALAIQESKGGFMQDPDDYDFVEPNAKRARPAVEEDSVAFHLPPGPNQDPAAALGGCVPPLRMPKKQNVPKIYFGTRTHKQVSQIVRELKKTAYSGVRMTILGSREHTCIHPTISRSFNKNQDCQELMDKRKGGGCRFQMNVKAKLASHHSLRVHMGHENAWDLEDIVKVGKKIKCCPYFAVRELRTAAQLIICPYNYLVDPKIRKSMEISLKNQIVVIDEAHNIEDSARDAVSGSFNIDDIGIAMQECERMVGFQVLPETHSQLADFCSRLANWMQKCIETKPDYSDWNSSSRVWKGSNAMAEWNEQVFAPSNYGTIKAWVDEALKEQAAANEEQEGEESIPILSKKASEVLEGVFMLLEYMYTRDSMYRDDYRMAVVKSQTRKKGGGGGKGWLAKGENSTNLVNVINLHFWCLNPAVCFNDLKNECRSVVLTSGTLSPIVTFASELDAKFPITLEADHVIDRKQVWVGTLSHGPSGHNLNATYRNTETLAFQDEVGRLVESVCHKVPHGILLFLPSYKMLDTLTNRWQMTGTWANIMQRKTIVSEPRFSDQLDGVMKEFYEAIVVNDGKGEIGQDGALFMAVCRGKVSEGLDFADNNARAVICVGIPFPNVKDSLVDLKRKYNDNKRATRDPNILSGAEWYEIQAFRALNQALGRCIRHKKDWGAILMVDDRYRKNEKYVNGLSKWVRKNVVHYSNTREMFQTIGNFVDDMKLMESEEALLESQAKVPSPDKTPEKESNPELPEISLSDTCSNQSSSSAWTNNEDNETTSSKLAAKIAQLQSFNREYKEYRGRKPRQPRQPRQRTGKNHNLDAQTHLNSSQNLNGSQHFPIFDRLNLKRKAEDTTSRQVDDESIILVSDTEDEKQKFDDKSLLSDRKTFNLKTDIAEENQESDDLMLNNESDNLQQFEDQFKAADENNHLGDGDKSALLFPTSDVIHLPDSDFEAKKKSLGVDLFGDDSIKSSDSHMATEKDKSANEVNPEAATEEDVSVAKEILNNHAPKTSNSVDLPSAANAPVISQNVQVEQGFRDVDGPLNLSDSVRHVSEKSLLNSDTGSITNTTPSSNSRWVQMFKTRKDNRLANSSSKKREPKPTLDVKVVPDTPEKKDDAELFDWDDDFLPPSDNEQDPGFAKRKPLFESSHVTNRPQGADKESASAIGKKMGEENKPTHDVKVAGFDQDLGRSLKSPVTDDISFSEISESSFVTGTTSSRLKKKVKRKSGNRSIVRQKLPLYNSDDDFV